MRLIYVIEVATILAIVLMLALGLQLDMKLDACDPERDDRPETCSQ